MRIVSLVVVLWILFSACNGNNQDSYSPVPNDLSPTDFDATLDAAGASTGAGQVGGDPVTEKLCRWDACGGPLPVDRAAALDPEDR